MVMASAGEGVPAIPVTAAEFLVVFFDMSSLAANVPVVFSLTAAERRSEDHRSRMSNGGSSLAKSVLYIPRVFRLIATLFQKKTSARSYYSSPIAIFSV